jgi:hypothetical protein
MSAGKVMLGTDGNPLLSADGKIVLADDLYPMTSGLGTSNEFARYKENSSGCALTDIWSRSFGDPIGWGAAFSGVSGGTSAAYHYVMQYILPEGSVDWARVKKIKVPVSLSWSSFDDPPATMRITSSKNNSTIPSNTDIRDVWDVAADFSELWEGSREIEVEWIIDGVKPDSIEIAMMPIADTCAVSGYSFLGLADYVPHLLRIVYNLATA